MSPATVFVVDDDVAVRDSISILFETAGLLVECHDSAESFLKDYRPDRSGCLVLDVRMDRMSGPELQEELIRRGSTIPIIFLTGHGDIPLTVRTIKAGAVNFLTKPVDGAELLDNVLAVLDTRQGQASESSGDHVTKARFSSLTDREREVLSLVIEGLSNKNVATQLGISHRTVEIHKARILAKTGTSSILELARLADSHGWRR